MKNLLSAAARELAGLFVDDGVLAVSILAVVALAAIVATQIHDLTGGMLLIAGSVFVLFASVITARL